MKNILILSIVALLLLGCGKKQNDSSATSNVQSTNSGEIKSAGESNSESPDSLKYEIRKFHKTYKGCNDNEENCSYMKIEYPVFTSGKSYKRINEAIYAYLADSVYLVEEGMSNKTLEKLADNYFKDYETMKKDNPDWGLSYAFESAGRVPYNKGNVVTVEINTYAFTGGAHPNSYNVYFVFDIETGNRLRVQDIFVKGFESGLNKLIEKKYREFRGISDKERLDGENGMLFENHIEFNDNFGLLKDGVIFYYNSYEIAAYAVGPTELNFTYKELGDLLKPEYKK